LRSFYKGTRSINRLEIYMDNLVMTRSALMKRNQAKLKIDSNHYYIGRVTAVNSIDSLYPNVQE